MRTLLELAGIALLGLYACLSAALFLSKVPLYGYAHTTVWVVAVVCAVRPLGDGAWEPRAELDRLLWWGCGPLVLWPMAFSDGLDSKQPALSVQLAFGLLLAHPWLLALAFGARRALAARAAKGGAR